MSTTAQQLQALLKLSSSLGNTTGNTTVGAGAGDAANAAGLVAGIQQGGTQGDVNAAANAGSLYGKLSGNNSITQGAGDLGDVAGIYSGIQNGGLAGYGMSAADAAKLAGSLSGNAALSTVGGYIAAPLSLYEFGKNWQSGATGADALSGAEAGASVGSIVPGIGTVIGGLIGGAAGALSSAFGGGKPDPETEALQNLEGQYGAAYNQDPAAAQSALSQLTPADSFQTLAGAFDAKNNTPGHSQPIEQALGRMNEGTFLNDAAGQINQDENNGDIIQNPDGSITVNTTGALGANNVPIMGTGGGKVTYAAGAAPQALYSQVVNPWIQSQTNGQGILGPSNGEGGILSGAIQNLIGGYTSGALTNQTPIGISGQTDSSLPAYAGLSALQGTTTPAATATPALSGVPATTPITRPVMQASGGKVMRRIQRFDDGGDVDSGLDLDTGDILSGGYDGGLNLSNSGILSGQSNNFDTGYDTASGQGSSALNSLLSQATTSSGSTGSNSSLLSALLGQGSNGSTSLAGLLKTYAPLLPLIGALTGATTPKAATAAAAPAGYGAIPAIATPTFQRSQAGSQVATSPQNWYTYGQSAPQQFFQNNQLPYVAGISPASAAVTQAKGGSTPPSDDEEEWAPQGALDMTNESGANHVPDPGYGDGTSDDVPAQLSSGEYVVPASVVAALGNGSNDAGARQLDALQKRVRMKTGKLMAQNKHPIGKNAAKKPEAYMRSAKS